MRTIAIIPARGGSKGVPKKNIRDLCGIPLIGYSVIAAKESGCIDTVMVTTDSEEIASIAKGFGADVPFLRPAELASDEAKTIDCVVHALKYYESLGNYFDNVILLQPTSPLRTAADIKGCYSRFIECGRVGTVSVCLTSENPVLLRTIDTTNWHLEALLGVGSTIRRQDMPNYYRINGSIYIYASQDIVPDLSMADAPIGYVMPTERSVDIDTLEDFATAERLMQVCHHAKSSSGNTREVSC